MTHGTIKPATEPMPFVRPVIVPEKLGLKSIGFTKLLDARNPCEPTDIMKNIPTSNALHPAYPAANTKQPSTIAAMSKIK